MPGASTTSAILVSIAAFSGCCFWECSPENGLKNLEGLGSSWETSMAQESHAESMAREGARSGPNVIKDIASSLDVRATTLRAETLHTRFQGIDDIASPLSIFEYLKLGPLKGGTVHSQLDLLKNITTVVEHHQGASSTTSMLANLCGLAVIFDVLLALGCFMLCRRGYSELAPAVQNSNGMPACVVRPRFAQAKVPVSQECPVFPDDRRAVDATLVHKPAEKSLAQSSPPPQKEVDAELQARINTIVGPRVNQQQQQLQNTKACSDEELKARINTIVGARSECRKQSEDYVQLKASIAVSEAAERKLAGASPDAMQLGASPCAAQSLSNIELAYRANLALSAAKDRNTPAKSPAPAFVRWEPHPEKDIVPCQLDFADGDDVATQEDEKQAALPVQPVHLEPVAAVLAEPEQGSVDNHEAETHPAEVSQVPVLEEEAVDDEEPAETCPDEELKVRINAIVSARKDAAYGTSQFDVSLVPSPTRSRARQQLLAEEQATSSGSWETVDESATNSGSWSAAKKQLLRGAWPSFQQTPGKDRVGMTARHLGFGSLTPGVGEDVAARKADAFQAWGVPSPEVIGRPGGWKWQ